MFSGTKLYARDDIINSPVMHCDYNWETTDEGQKTVAMKMTWAALFLTALAAALAAAIPSSTGGNTEEFTQGSTKNTLLSD